ncbi:MAG: RAMP superfamily CRISPR-associated protein [Thermoanaerobaculia bacterium]
MPRLEILLHGPLLVGGGQTPGWGAHLATLRTLKNGAWLPYIPATALRGAVRLQLEALLAGAGKAPTGPYPLDGEGGALPPDSDPVARLFGYSGRQGERTGSKEGLVRFGDALPSEEHRARFARSFGLRPGVEIDDRTGAAARQKLFFRELAEASSKPVALEADLEIDDAEPELVELLRAAAESTTAIGAGKSTGSGAVEIRWHEDEAAGAGERNEELTDADSATLVLTLLEPAHFGDGGPRRNHHGTRTYLPGATLRGAIAWALLRSGQARPEDSAFQQLFLGESALSFGDGLLLAPGSSQPELHSVGRRAELLPGGKRISDCLPRELARESVNRRLEDSGRTLRADDGPHKHEPLPPRPGGQLLRRTRTRLSLDRRTGAAASSRLFSIEQLENYQPDHPDQPVQFLARIEGLDRAGREALKLLAKLEGVSLFVGAGRHHGLGKVSCELRFEQRQPSAQLAEACRQVAAFTAAAQESSRELAARAGLGDVQEPPVGRCLLALVATSDYLPNARRSHPLAEVLGEAPEPCRRFLLPSAQGGYNQQPEADGGGREPPLKTLRSALGAGSVFVYELPESELEAVLRQALPELARGVGLNVESGCGRFQPWQPWVEAPESKPKPRSRTMRTELSAELKAELVRDAENIAKKILKKKNEATSQLRNLVQITQTESSVPVLRNFLRYQAGRKATRELWQQILGDTVAIRKLEGAGPPTGASPRASELLQGRARRLLTGARARLPHAPG